MAGCKTKSKSKSKSKMSLSTSKTVVKNNLKPKGSK